MECYASLLGLKKPPSECSTKEVRTAYKASALVNHPDKGGDVDKFRAVQEAYSKLVDFVEGKNKLSVKPDPISTAHGINRKTKLSVIPDPISTAHGIKRYLDSCNRHTEPLATLLKIELIRTKGFVSGKRKRFSDTTCDALARDYIERSRKFFRETKMNPKALKSIYEWFTFNEEGRD